MASQQKLRPAIELAKKNGVRFPNESNEYRRARTTLLAKEIELRRAMEAVAVARRALPSGGLVPEDYGFEGLGPDGKAAQIRLSELFASGRNSLLVYNFMFPRHPTDDRPGPPEGATARLKRGDGPCPSCVAFLDQLDGAAEHLRAAGFNFAIIAKAPLDRLIAFANERGWRHLRLLSAARNSFKHDYLAETPEGYQMPMMTVFHRDGHSIRHFWSSEMLYKDPDSGQDPRHCGTLEPLWNLMDLTPEGRPSNWNEQLSYADSAGKSPNT